MLKKAIQFMIISAIGFAFLNAMSVGDRKEDHRSASTAPMSLRALGISPIALTAFSTMTFSSVVG